MKRILLLSIALVTSSCADNSMSQRDMNLKVVNTFWDNILTENYQVALDMLHEDLEFEFMGICTICKKYDREGFEKDWFMTVIPEVLPNGIVINKVNQMADDEWVVTTFVGEASPTKVVTTHSSSCLLYTSPSPRDKRQSRMPSSA